MEWIKFLEQKPPINIDVLIWVFDDFNYCDIGRWNGNVDAFCSGWDTNNDLSKYRKITHWSFVPESPKE